MKSKTVASGLLIAFAGPPLGLLALILVVGGFDYFADPGSMSFRRDIFGPLLIAYAFSGLQSMIAGFVVTYELQQKGWVSLMDWLILAVCLGIAPSILRLLTQSPPSHHLSIWNPTQSDLLIRDIEVFLLPTLFAAIVLRVAVISLGWMQRPSSRS